MKEAFLWGAFAWALTGAAWAANEASPYLIEVSKTKNVMVLFRDGRTFKTYVVATGMNGSTPAGTFRVVEKIPHPTWYKPGGPTYPPNDPDNGLGTRWLGFDKKGYGIHGTIEPWKLGTQASHGCVRMRNQDVEELFEIVPRGTPVRIVE